MRERHKTARGEGSTGTVIQEWLARVAPGKTFLEIGCLFANERVTAAHRAGASHLAAADIIPASHDWWTRFNQVCEAAGAIDVQCYPGFDVLNRQQVAELGKFDIVTASGIMYHCPDMLDFLLRVRSLTNGYLITNTVILPTVIENEHGKLECPEGTGLFLPSLAEQQRKVLRAYYTAKFAKPPSDRSPPPDEARAYYVPNGQPSTEPNWWYVSPSLLYALSTIAGFSIEEEYVWRDHASTLLLKAT